MHLPGERESAVTHKRFSSENTDPAGVGQMKLRTANSPFFSVGSGCPAVWLQMPALIPIVSGFLSYGIRLTAPIPGLPAMHQDGREQPTPSCPVSCSPRQIKGAG